ncbi:hypothetical protein M885DRAFT_550918 [Pelagophyceae sp. CCMP2097]|nr:hypothetical protein M885DRAFT_550918 [Pelagophyceae sp. CCMP2097]
MPRRAVGRLVALATLWGRPVAPAGDGVAADAPGLVPADALGLVPPATPVVDVFDADAAWPPGHGVSLAFAVRGHGDSKVMVQLDGASGSLACEGPGCGGTMRATLTRVGEAGWHSAAVIIAPPSGADYAAVAMPFYACRGATDDAAPDAAPDGLPIAETGGAAETAAAEGGGAGDAEPAWCARRPRAFSVHVIAYARLAGLERLLESLAAARYGAHNVALRVHVDFPPPGASAATLAANAAAARVARRFHWPHGSSEVRLRSAHAGAALNRLEAWTPACDGDVGAFFEDDVAVSPAWFDFSTAALEAYGGRGRAAGAVAGVVLQRNWLVPACYLKEADARNAFQPYLSPVLGPYAHVVAGAWWRRFTAWHRTRPKGDVRVPGNSFSNGWLRGAHAERDLWTAYADRFAFDTGALFVYGNLPGGAALARNHAGPGLHYSGDKGVDAAAFDESSEWAPRLLFFPERPAVLDWAGLARSRAAPGGYESGVNECAADACAADACAADARTADARAAAAPDGESLIRQALHPLDRVALWRRENAGGCAPGEQVPVDALVIDVGFGAFQSPLLASHDRRLVSRACGATAADAVARAAVSPFGAIVVIAGNLDDAAGVALDGEVDAVLHAAAAHYELERGVRRGTAVGYVLRRRDGDNPPAVLARYHRGGAVEEVPLRRKYGMVQDLRPVG